MERETFPIALSRASSFLCKFRSYPNRSRQEALLGEFVDRSGKIQNQGRSVSSSPRRGEGGRVQGREDHFGSDVF